ncbi:hypothetical protein, partial [Klebsiella pneumoniae]|uniref:hypothetical protein n=1 Tax=Klebsiella pneumoniae TaxID=573 RepID=UPI001C6F6677
GNICQCSPPGTGWCICARIINTTKQNIFWTFIPIVPKCPGRKAFFVYLLFIADEPDDVFFYWTESPDRPGGRGN